MVLAGDTSGYGMWAVISHIFTEGSEKAIAHISRAPTPTEKNYGKIEKKALTIIYVVKNSIITQMTPNKPQAFVVNIWLKKMSPSLFSNSSSTVSTHINEYGYNIRYQKTEDFDQADRLSRLIDNQLTQNEKTGRIRVGWKKLCSSPTMHPDGCIISIFSSFPTKGYCCFNQIISHMNLT